MAHRLDIGWSTGPALVSRLIRFFDRSAFSHVFWKFTIDEMRFAYESHFKGGIQVTPWERFEAAVRSGKVNKYYLFDLKLDTEDVKNMYHACMKFHGESYDLRQIMLYLIWVKVFHRKPEKDYIPLVLNNLRRFTCNEFVVASLAMYEYENGRPLHDILNNVNETFTPEKLFEKVVGEPSLSLVKKLSQ